MKKLFILFTFLGVCLIGIAQPAQKYINLCTMPSTGWKTNNGIYKITASAATSRLPDLCTVCLSSPFFEGPNDYTLNSPLKKSGIDFIFTNKPDDKYISYNTTDEIRSLTFQSLNSGAIGEFNLKEDAFNQTLNCKRVYVYHAYKPNETSTTCEYNNVTSTTVTNYNIKIQAPVELKPEFQGKKIQVCKTETSYDLKALFTQQDGFVFNPLAPINSTINPSTMPIGVNKFNYVKGYDNETVQVPFEIEVIDAPAPSISTPLISVCRNDVSFKLMDAFKPSITGGSFIYNGTEITDLDPSKYSGRGVKLKYEVKNSIGCKSATDVTVAIFDAEVISDLSITSRCLNDKAIALNITPSPLYNNSARLGIWKTNDNAALVKLGNTDSLISKYLLSGNNTLIYTYTNANKCVSSKTFNIKGLDTTKVNISTITPPCITGSKIDLNNYVQNNTGGTWVGKGTAGNLFDPKVAGVGFSTLYYKFTNSNNCNSSNKVTFEVLDAITTFTGNWTGGFACNNSAGFNLNKSVKPYPYGGLWKGNGITGDSIFNPKLIPVGSKVTITYEYKSSNGCVGSNTIGFKILQGDQVSAGNALTVCRNDKKIALNGSPTSWQYITQTSNFYKIGSYSGAGVISPTTLGRPDTINAPKDTLNPLLATSGDYLYTYTGAQGCVSYANKKITIKDTLEISLVGLPEYCNNEKESDLMKLVDLKGGSWSGKSVKNNKLYADSLTSGDYKFLYTYTDKISGCTSRKVIAIKIKPLPAITGFFTDKQVCKNTPSLNLYLDISPVPYTGTFKGGPGFNSGTFIPSETLRDTNIVNYTYTDLASQCSNSITKRYIVRMLDEINLDATKDICSNNKPFAFTVSPAQWQKDDAGAWKKKGVWTGSKIKAASVYPALDTLNPRLIAKGEYSYTYTFTNKYNCVSKDTILLAITDTSFVSFGSADTAICKNSATISLKKLVSPLGGQFKLDGDFLSAFDPSISDLGNNIVYYTIVDRFSCQSTVKKNFILKANPVIKGAVDTVLNICDNQGLLDLKKVVLKPIGGTYSNYYVTSNVFNPKSADLTNTIKYVGTQDNCTGEASFTIKVSKSRLNQIYPDISICQNGSKLELGEKFGAIFSPQGQRFGVWSGNGIVNGKGLIYDSLNPAIAKLGTDSIRYIYVDENKCKSNSALQLTVLSKPVASITTNKLKAEWGEAIQFFSNANTAIEYSWDFGDGGISTTKDPWHYFYVQDTATVKLKVKSKEGCEASVKSSPTLFRIIGKKPKDLADAPSLSNYSFDTGGFVNLYPTPTVNDAECFIYLYEPEKIKINIVNTLGIQVFSEVQNTSAGVNKITIPSGQFAPGFYEVMITSTNLNKKFKLIKE